MIRVIVENMLLFLLPTLIYVGYMLLVRPQDQASAQGGTAGGVLDDAPLLWLFVAGAALVLVTLIAFGSSSGGRPGQHYEPSVLKDGRIEPGHID